VSLIPRFSGAKFLETAVVVIAVMIVLDMVPALRFWTRWTRPVSA